MTGLSQDQVTALIAAVSTLLGDPWQPTTGRRKSLDLSRAVVLTLFLLRHDNVQDVAGELFGCSQATVSRTSRRIRPLLQQATAALAQRVAARARLGAVLLDGLIAPTGERRDHTDLFSGKHRVCGMNMQVITDLDGQIIDTGTPIGESRHDSIAFNASGPADRSATHLTDGGPGMHANKGYQGCGPTTPYRKPPGRPHTPARQACNHALNSLRAAVERAISHLVNWKILDIGYRGRPTEFPNLLHTVTNLEIYRVWG